MSSSYPSIADRRTILLIQAGLIPWGLELGRNGTG